MSGQAYIGELVDPDGDGTVAWPPEQPQILGPERHSQDVELARGEIEQYRLLYLAFPVVNPNHRLDGEFANKNRVHGFS